MVVRERFVRNRKAIAVTSMARIRDRIYCGLTGGSHAIAVIDTKDDSISLCCETFPWVRDKSYCTKIHNSLCVYKGDTLLAGECSHLTWDGLPVYNQYLKAELPERMLQRKREQGYPDIAYSDFALERLDDWNRNRDDPGGKIVCYDAASDTVSVLAALPAYLYSQSMTADPERERAYINTIPDNHFLVVDCRTGTVRDLGRISEYGHHNMCIAPNGRVYAAWVDYYNRSLKLLRYDPDEDRLYHTDRLILRDIGNKIAGNQGIDQWIVTRKGEIYFGCVSNSLIFRFYWEDETFELIGRATETGRVATMDEDEKGTIWLGAGYPEMHLVRFDPSLSGRSRFADCGPVSSGKTRCYFHASCLFENRLYLGETDGFTPSVHIVDLSAL